MRILIVLDRGDYWQAGLVFSKGRYQELREQGLEELRRCIVEMAPHFAPTLCPWPTGGNSHCSLWNPAAVRSGTSPGSC